MTVPELRALLAHLLDVRVWDVAEILRWSKWRQERNRRAEVSHKKRRLAELQQTSQKNDTDASTTKNVRPDKHTMANSLTPPSRPT
jgi:hypothetical protein